jgi:hypothetical protein
MLVIKHLGGFHPGPGPYPCQWQRLTYEENMDDDILTTVFSQGPQGKEARIETGLIAIGANSNWLDHCKSQ